MHAKYASKIRLTALSLLCLAATVFTPALADPLHSGLHDLGTLGNDYAFPTPVGGCINQFGQIIGEAGLGVFDPDFGELHHAFLYKNGTLVDIAPLSGDALSSPSALNDFGQVLAFSIGYNGQRAFLYDSGHTYPILPLVSGAETVGTSLNIVGQAIGTTPVVAGDRGFLWDRVHGTRGINTLYPDPAHHGQYLGSSQANALNTVGQVAGWANTPDTDQFGFSLMHAILYDGSTHDLGTLSPDPAHHGHFLGQSMATGINDLGQIIGIADTNQSDGFGGVLTHAFVWDSIHGMRDLGTLYPDPAHSGKFLGGSTPFAINAFGQIIGVADTNQVDIFGFPVSHAFLWTPGGTNGIHSNPQMKDLGTLPGGSVSVPTGLNNLGQVIGTSDTANSFQHAFLYSNGVMRDVTPNLDFNLSSTPVALNQLGQMVGFYDAEGGASIHPFLFSFGTFTDLGTLGGNQSFADGINDSGVIAGSSLIGGGDFPPFHAWVTGPIF